MPKVNTNFFPCPDCGCIKFVPETEIVFVKKEGSTEPGTVYQAEVTYKCKQCGKVVKREIM